MTEKQLEKYIKGKYIGMIKGNYDIYCSLTASEINNFVQNAGKYADLVIVKLRTNEILFDTHGQFINRILPELSESDRNSVDIQKTINQIATKFNELRLNDQIGEGPIKKVQRFISEAFNEEIVETMIKEKTILTQLI